MNLSTFFKSRDYDNMDRFFLQQKINGAKDPFEGDPFKVQSLNFRYADRPKFYPIASRSNCVEVAEKLRSKNILQSHSSHVPPQKSDRIIAYTKTPSVAANGRKHSSVCCFPVISKAEKSDRIAGSKFNFNRSRSFISADVSRPSNPVLQQRSETKVKHSRSASKENNESIANINLDHTGGCKISIKINGIPSNNKVHINEKVSGRDIFLNRNNDVTKVTTKTITSPYEVKPSRSYVIRRDDSVSDIQKQNPKVQKSSSRKIVRECSTHSMIPHKEENSNSKDLRKQSRSVADFNVEPSRRRSSLNLSRTDARNILQEKFNRNNSSVQLLSGLRRTDSSTQMMNGRNLERQASSAQLLTARIRRTDSSTQMMNGRNLERQASSAQLLTGIRRTDSSTQMMHGRNLDRQASSAQLITGIRRTDSSTQMMHGRNLGRQASSAQILTGIRRTDSSTQMMNGRNLGRQASSAQILTGIRRTDSSTQMMNGRNLGRQASSAQLITTGLRRTGSSTQIMNGRNVEKKASSVQIVTTGLRRTGSSTQMMNGRNLGRQASSAQLITTGLRRTGSSTQMMNGRNLERQASSTQMLTSAKRIDASTQVLDERNLERRASMLEKILSNNPIVTPSRNNYVLRKSVSVLDQRMTPLQTSRKFFSLEPQR